MTAGGLAGCNKSANSGDTDDRTSNAANDERKPLIGVSLLTLADPFFITMKDAMAAEAEAQGYELTVVAAEKDPAKQMNQVDDFLTRKVAAIVLCPADSKSIGTAIAKANDAGVPVFTADIAALTDNVEVVSHIATDNYAGGKLAAAAMHDALGGTGKIAIIDHPEVESVIARTRGFEEGLVEQAGDEDGVEVVAKLPCQGARDRAFNVMEDILQSHSDIRGVFCINDQTALGAIAALEKADRLADIVVVGFDGLPEARAALEAGKMYADVLQHPDQIGRNAIRSVAAYTKGKDIPAEQLIAPTLITRDDE